MASPRALILFALVAAAPACAPDLGPDVVVEVGDNAGDDGTGGGRDEGTGDADDAGTADADDAGTADDAGSGDGADDVDAGSGDAGPDDRGDAGSDDGVDGGVVVDEPVFADLPWETGADVGFGVAHKDSGNPRGDDVFVGYGGFGTSLDDSCAWVTALYEAALRDRGVRFVYCVQGPATVGYVGLEIGNSKVARRLVTEVTARTRFILVAAHSSGSFVAHELLRQLADPFLDLDPDDLTTDRVVYVNLDGGAAGLPLSAVQRLRHAAFVAAVDVDTATASPNRSTMVTSGGAYGSAASYRQLDVADSGCASGGVWCVHMTPITTRPHDARQAATSLDYRDFVGRPVATAWIDLVAPLLGP
jgi:hypothetical protein